MIIVARSRSKLTMEELFKPEEKKRGVNRVFIVGTIIGVLAIAAAIGLLMRKPSMEDQTAKLLEGALHPGAPGFDEIQKDMIFWKDPNTVESPTGMGTITMYIKAHVKNKGTKSISILEVDVVVVDQQEQTVREKRVVVVPVQQPGLAPDQVIPITTEISGFDKKEDRANIRFHVTAIKTAN